MTYHKIWFYSGHGYVFESGLRSELVAKRHLYNFLRNNYISLGYKSFNHCKNDIGTVFKIDYDIILY